MRPLAMLGAALLLFVSSGTMAGESPRRGRNRPLSIRMTITVQNGEVRSGQNFSAVVTVENLLDEPVRYAQWSCSPNDNFQLTRATSNCFTLQPKGGDCDKNYKSVLYIVKGQPLVQTLDVTIAQSCTSGKAPLSASFYADGGSGEKRSPLAKSGEILVSIVP